MATRARFSVVRRAADFVAIIDHDDGAMSVTNDAEGVVEQLTKERTLGPGTRLVYRDSEGIWDELKHNGAGKFTGFAPIRASGLEEAIKKLRGIR